ncbi:hypothetical protein M426DRAFT_77949 [Hypoxylon sp. CI-4A]|nr:hypothetical protein M426DRAFT_77949 [Hypoxylon sp. CI-4A]
MGVSFEQAKKWERFAAPFESRIAKYFAKERTKAWPTRLAEYYQRIHTESNSALEKVLDVERRRRIGTEFHGFMYLPIEVRHMIYRYRLVKGTVFIPEGPEKKQMDLTHIEIGDYNGELYQRFEGIPSDWGRQPSIGLICGVTRTIHAEAMPIFDRLNRFVFPTLGWPGIAPAMRDISCTFDMRQENLSDYEAGFAYQEQQQQDRDFRPADREAGDPSFPAFSVTEYLAGLHNTKLERLGRRWTHVVETMHLRALDRLQLDFQECMCPLGCCRLVGFVVDLLTAEDDLAVWRDAPPRVFEILGWKNDKERAVIERSLRTLSTDLIAVDVRFLGRSKSEVRDERLVALYF